MNINLTCNRLRVAFKHSTLAAAVAVGLAAGSVQAATTTSVIDLGAFESGGTAFAGGALESKIPLGSLPAGSILRSVTMNYRLEAGDPYLGDLRVLFADATADNGVLQIAGNIDDGGYTKTASPSVTWNSGDDFSVGTTATQTLTAADGIPAIDLNTVAVWLHTGYPGSWAGSVTLEYDVPVTAAIITFGPDAVVGDLVANAADITWTLPFGTNVTTLAPTFTLTTGACDRDNGGPTTYDFTSPVTYTVTDGMTVNTYTVTVFVTPASSAMDILTFGPNAVVSGTDIAWTVPFGSNVANLAPTYTVSTFASGSPLSGTAGDFTTPQTYTITAQDGSTQDYTVTVTVAPDDATVTWNLASGGAWDSAALNWLGQTSNIVTLFDNGDNAIFNNAAGGTIAIAAGGVSPLSTTVSASSGSYSFSGGPIATGSLSKSDAGTLRLLSANSYGGGTVIDGGTLLVDLLANDALGIGPVTLNTGLLFLERITAANNLIVNGGTLRPSNGFGCAWNGTVTLNSDLIISGDGNSGGMSFNGAISGVGGLIFQGPNALRPVLAVANSYTGPTSVTGCTLRSDNVDALGSGALSISSADNSKVNLNYVGTKTVASLTLGGVARTAPGTYGSVASLADFPDDTYFTTGSTGTVTIGGGGSDYDTWLAEFTFAPGADTTPTGDPDGDGMSNQEEYAFGLNPTLGTSVNPIVVPLDPLTGNFQYTRRATPAATGLTYNVLTSTTLAGWATGGATETGFTTSGNIQTVTVNVTALPVDGRLFVRVEALPTAVE